MTVLPMVLILIVFHRALRVPRQPARIPSRNSSR
jgi:hypothetical protein